MEKLKTGMSAGASIIANPSVSEKLGFHNVYTFECYDSEGNLKWEEEVTNIVTNEGINHVLDVVFDGATPITSWYCGLTQGTVTVNAADTLASHAGWVEQTGITDNPARDLVNFDTLSAGQVSIDNSENVATFTFSDISGDVTVGGAFLCSSASGTSGILYGVADFSGNDRTISQGDVVNVLVNIQLTSSA